MSLGPRHDAWRLSRSFRASACKEIEIFSQFRNVVGCNEFDLAIDEKETNRTISLDNAGIYRVTPAAERQKVDVIGLAGQ